MRRHHDPSPCVSARSRGSSGSRVYRSGSAGASAASDVAAADGPGTTSHQDQSRKDCVGTARNTTSKIWFTVANGVLSDVYAPTVDATNVETMQYIVTDGSTFTDLQTRDMTYTVKSDATGMTCTVTSTAKDKSYKLVTTYLTDPSRDSVVLHTTFVPATRAARNDQLFVRLDANAGGNGGGGTANGGADTAVTDTSTGSAIPVSFDTNTTQPGEPHRLCGAVIPRAHRQQAVLGREQRLRRHPERWPDPARRHPRARPDHHVRDTTETSSRRRASRSTGTVRPRSRSGSEPPRRRPWQRRPRLRRRRSAG